MSFPAVVGVDAHTPDQLLALFTRLIPCLFVGSHLSCDRRLGRSLLRVSRISTARGRQIADMSHAGFDDKVLTQILIDGLRLGGRFDDDKLHEW